MNEYRKVAEYKINTEIHQVLYTNNKQSEGEIKENNPIYNFI